MPIRSAGGIPSENPWNATHAQPSMSYYGSQSMMPQQEKNMYAGYGHGFYQNLG
jgi:hypothetical protein